MGRKGWGKGEEAGGGIIKVWEMMMTMLLLFTNCLSFLNLDFRINHHEEWFSTSMNGLKINIDYVFLVSNSELFD